MSHQPERADRDCLNCGTIVRGRFCHVCGQENILPKQSFWSLVSHFVFDIFHFDGKFFDTLKLLITRPGLVAKEYTEGKRMKYLDPIRMYLFTSAVFFLIFFSIEKTPVFNVSDNYLSRQDRFKEAARLYADSSNYANRYKIALLLDTSKSLKLETRNKAPVTDSNSILLEDKRYLIVPESKDKLVTKADSRSWIGNLINSGIEKKKQQYGDDSKGMVKAVSDSFLHRLPYMMFISLPFFALMLKLLYLRKERFYYSDHSAFTLYHYIFSFLLFLAFLLVAKLKNLIGWQPLQWLEILLILTWPVYLFISMKRFYRQGSGKTLIKFLLINIMGTFFLIILFILFGIISLII